MHSDSSWRMPRPCSSGFVLRALSVGTEVSSDQIWIEAGVGCGKCWTVRGAERVEIARYSST